MSILTTHTTPIIEVTQRYLITGISGFVGTHLAQRLYDEGHKVYALTRSSAGREADILDVVSKECYDSITFLYGDLLDYNSLLKAFQVDPFQGFDGVFHCAAQSHPPTGFLDPIGTLKTNLIGSANLFDVVEKTHGLSCKICVVSTSEVYGNSGSDGRLLKETDMLAPCNPYASGKAAMDLHFQERMMNGKNSGFITRAFSHTGPRRGKTFSISSDAYQIAGFIHEEMQSGDKDSSESAYILKIGNLQTTRVVLDVKDVVDAYYRLMIHEDSNGKIFNVCGNTPRKMEYFTDALIRFSQLNNIEKEIDEKLYRKHDIHYQHGDTTLLRELTGWSVTIRIEDTLRDLLKYWIKKQSK